MDLLRFPTEILGLIVSFPSTSYLLLRLWKCGNKALTARLAMGVTEVHWQHESHLRSTFPSLVFDLPKLHHLTLVAPAGLMTNTSRWHSVLDSLPKGLQTLHLVASGEGPFLLSRANQVDLNTLLPSLSTLILQSSYLKMVQALTLQLPSNLTRLSLDVLISSVEPRFASYLPRSLRYLGGMVSIKCYWTMIDKSHMAQLMRDISDDWSHAPPHLEHIELLNFHQSPSTLPWLPRTLLSCKLDPIIWSLDMASSLPPKLQKLCISSNGAINESGWDALPKNLTSLACRTSFNSDPVYLSELPQSLKYLSIDSFADLSGQPHRFRAKIGRHGVLAPNLLPNLRTLHLFNLKSLRPEIIKSLPTGLTELSLTIGYLTNTHLRLRGDAFPKSLKSLSLRIGNARITYTAEIVGALPSSLTFFRFLSYSARCFGVPRQSIESLPDSISSLKLASISRYSDDVRSVYMNRAFGPWKAPLKLPMSLTSVSLAECLSSWFPSLPRSLTKLKVAILRIPVISQRLLEMDIFEGLPPKLTELNCIEMDHFGGVPTASKANIVSHLSFSKTIIPALTSLRICTPKFPHTVLKNLPRGLKSLAIQLDIPTEMAYEEAFQDAPPGIIKLEEKMTHYGYWAQTETYQDRVESHYH